MSKLVGKLTSIGLILPQWQAFCQFIPVPKESHKYSALRVVKYIQKDVQFGTIDG